MGLDLEFMVNRIPDFIKATVMTLKLSVLSIIFSIMLGILIEVARYFNVKIIGIISKVYIEFSRNTPLLLQVFFLYFGLTKLGIKLSGFACGVIGLSFLGGAYMAESFRAGVDAVSKSQMESGQALGLSKIQILRYIVLPISFSISIPSVAANCIFLVKETSVIASIAVGELMFVTKGIIGMYYKTKESLILVVIFYLIILLPMSIAARKIERRLRYGEFGS
ncbi:amino acid ABC transporter permease [Clostridium isatidis]|uniref:Amino acid ABC transporter n=1 Tax=Clostridium isatidis TaxID=182773 RepID=A0A343JCY6_9CLOT|nr:amino acid ABC transporter permease [Clostridium isatidis]ASW43394.1 amino acid ABC transporter [Clostridium isatidis]NLZ33909.1 amino acid ABC transporter permease [Clostridiales bacterium]